ncbi:PaaI family thioesterase [Actinophytocola sp.]|uniref:PaaI family thioesterase n=1 Tax=Actinophytocola sp. TaxID=1872138 RepID=UPI002ED5DAA4
MTATGKPDFPNMEVTGAFLTSVGLVFEEVTGQRARGYVELNADHHTPWGVVHGGVYTTIIESVASVGASVAVMDKGMFAVGVNNNTDFLSSLREGRVVAEGEAVHQGRVQQLWLVELRTEAGKLVARGTVRLQNVPRERPS